jgi:hypothetical protein
MTPSRRTEEQSWVYAIVLERYNHPAWSPDMNRHVSSPMPSDEVDIAITDYVNSVKARAQKK